MVRWEGPRAVGTAAAICVAVAAAVAPTGCGEEAGTVATSDPAATFAPVVLVAHDEPRPPISVYDYLQRAVLWWADDQGCGDRKVSVGRTLGEQRTDSVDWTFPVGLGHGPAYWRFRDGADCHLAIGHRYEANELTRPYERAGRVRGLRLTEGYYLDLDDSALGGLRPRRDGRRRPAVTAYYEEREQDVDGEAGLRLSYWTLFTMNEPLGGRGARHEGDWERLDVLLRHGDDDGRFVPRAVVLHGPRGTRELTWDEVPRDPGQPTHPVLTSARGDHRLAPGRCGDCTRWRTWRSLASARRQPWYGYGGAWGAMGRGAATTGPLGPGA